MDNRAAKLASARKKLRDHQEKKSVCIQKDVLNTKSARASPIDIYGAQLSDDGHISMNYQFEKAQQVNEDIKMEQRSNHSGSPASSYFQDDKCYANVTEILISNKTNLEMENKELQSKIVQLDKILSKEVLENNLNKKKLCALEEELNDASRKYYLLTGSVSAQESVINELRNQLKSLTDDNNSLLEQQELTKTMLKTKEMEVSQLHSEICSLQNQLDVMMLQLQQLTCSDINVVNSQGTGSAECIGPLKEKIVILEQQLESTLKDKEQINSHYEHYVSRLNEQLRAQSSKYEALSIEVKGLYNRESALIEQIGQMEIRMQNYRNQTEAYAESHNDSYIQELKEKLAALQREMDELTCKHNSLQKEHEDSLNKFQELKQTRTEELCHDNISMKKLNADITSDKVAAQRATEQNKKLKTDVEELEQIVVKLGKDKLELTEKLSHEKQLNKQLMLKLAEIDEISKQTQTKLQAKDDEMIRLQANYRDIESKHEALLDTLLKSKENEVTNKYIVDEHNDVNGVEGEINNVRKRPTCSGDFEINEKIELKMDNTIPREDAMFKLQERFLNIMDQVANLSDEKHRLEHIILQLQNETDTICEYIALYQQQRSLLKKRDEERSAQIQYFQIECAEVKRQLHELSGLFLKLAQDKDLSLHLQVETRHEDIAKIKSLIENLLNSSLINSKCKNLDINNFYPCSCCSGQLIDV